jgi:hypothetical protein
MTPSKSIMGRFHQNEPLLKGLSSFEGQSHVLVVRGDIHRMTGNLGG